MMIVELDFSDEPARLAARPAHRHRLTDLHTRGVVRMAGPLADDSGAVIVFDADPATVEQIMADDPYYTTPGVTVRQVRQWCPFLP